jgi:hypothetical protein
MKQLIIFSTIFVMLGFASCKKDDSPAAAATPQGKWTGNAQYGTTPGNPTYFFSMDLKANGSVDIVGNNNTTADNATGNWALVQDSVKITYTYVTGTITYSLAGKYSAGSNVMVGTIGYGLSTTGAGLFTVTRQ